MEQSTPVPEFYRDLAALTGDVFWSMSVFPDAAVLFISENVVDLLGYTPEEFLAGGVEFMSSLVDPRDLPEMQRGIQTPTGQASYQELRYFHRDGHTVFVRLWLRRRVREDGREVVEGVTREVSALRRLESALRESEERFRNAMQSSAIGMCLVSPAGQFLETNPALCSLLGRDEATLQHTTWQTLTHPDDLHDDVTLVDDVLVGRRDSYRLLKRFLRPDGEVVWGDLSVSCVRDQEGRVRYFVSQIVDMTTQVETEHALRASEEQYRLLVEESSDFLMRTHGETGIIEWVSPSVNRVLGWEPEQAVGKSALEFLHPDDHARAFATRHAMDAGQRVMGRQRVLCRDGSYRWMSQVGRALFDADGTQIGRISSFQDIDAQVRAEEALAQSQAAAQADRERLRATMNAMLDPHFLISPVRDDDGRIIDFVHVDANDAGLMHAGFDRETFIGSRLLELIPGQESVINRYVETFESGQPMIEDAMPFVNPQAPDDPSQVRLFDLRGIRVGDALSITVRDVTAREQAAKELAESQARYRLLAENASDIVYRMHIDGTIEWLSDGVVHITGRSPESFIGHHIDEFVHGPDQDLIDAAAEEAVLTGKASVRFRTLDADGQLHWLEAALHPIESEAGTVLVGGCRDVQAEMQAIAELDRRARTDQLTGLPNRDEALSRLRLLLAKDRAAPIAVAFCDLDDFKTINDTFGHAVGDEWLRQATERIKSRVREGDLVARMGGDEILVVLPDVHNLDRATKACEKLRAALHDVDARSTVSIGVTLGWPGEGVDAVIARADNAMYQAKNAGRNRVVAV